MSSAATVMRSIPVRLFTQACVKPPAPMSSAVFACLFALIVSASASAQPRQFTPQAGFEGVSRGTGTLRMLFGKPRPFQVESRGSTLADGTFRLFQTIRMQGKPPRERTWVITTTRPGRYSATLSDAPGRVVGSHAGSRLSLRYRAMGPLVMDQQLELSPDGKTIDNVGTITFLGLRVGELKETIVRADGD